MAFHLTTRGGEFEVEPTIARMQEILTQLDIADAEHTSISLTHESEWCLAAYPGGLLVWENLESDEPPRHMNGVPQGKVLELWVKLSQGRLADVDSELWLPGYEGPAVLIPAARRVESAEWLGVLAVLFVAVVPDLFNATVVWTGLVESPIFSFEYTQLYLIVRALYVSVPVFVIVVLTRVDWKSVGVVPIRWIPDILMGLGVWLVAIVAYYSTARLLPASAFETFGSNTQTEQPANALGYGLLFFGSLANGFAEELVIRGYLFSHLERLLRSTWSALSITFLLFASYHLYQGIGPTLCIAVVGLVYGSAFCLFRRLWPLVFAHAITNFISWNLAA